MKKTVLFISVLIVSAIVLSASFGVVSASADTNAVEINDVTLKNAIISTLELSGDTITVNDMKRLTSLSTPENDPQKKITDISGLE